MDDQGDFVISKLAEAGGEVTTATCKEQLLYEIHDPSAYFTPDVVADFSKVILKEVGPNMVGANGASGRRKSGWLKVSIGYRDSYIGEGQISYAGPGARARAELAREIVEKRLQKIGVHVLESRFDLLGIDAMMSNSAVMYQELPEVRLRVVIRTASMNEAVRVGNEVESLYTNGPAGGGGGFKH